MIRHVYTIWYTHVYTYIYIYIHIISYYTFQEEGEIRTMISPPTPAITALVWNIFWGCTHRSGLWSHPNISYRGLCSGVGVVILVLRGARSFQYREPSTWFCAPPLPAPSTACFCWTLHMVLPPPHPAPFRHLRSKHTSTDYPSLPLQTIQYNII